MTFPTPIIPASNVLNIPVPGIGVTNRRAKALKNLLRGMFSGSWDQAFGDSVKGEKAASALSEVLTDYSAWLLNEEASIVRFNVDQWKNGPDGTLLSFNGSPGVAGAGDNAAYDEIGSVYFSSGTNTSIKVSQAAAGVAAGGAGQFLLLHQDRNTMDGPYVILADLLRVTFGEYVEINVVAGLGLDETSAYHAFAGGTWPTTAKNALLVNVLEYDANGSLVGAPSTISGAVFTSSIGTLSNYPLLYQCTSAQTRYIAIQIQASVSTAGGVGANDTYAQVHDVTARRIAGSNWQPPIGSIIGWTNHLATTPVDLVDLSAYTGKPWHACDGSTVSDGSSPLNGAVLPNLNSTTNPIFLGGHATTLTVAPIQAAALLTHTHVFTGNALPTHRHDCPNNAGVGDNIAVAAQSRTATYLGTGFNQPVSAGTPTGTNANAGGSADNNYPKHQSVIWIIRIK